MDTQAITARLDVEAWREYLRGYAPTTEDALKLLAHVETLTQQVAEAEAYGEVADGTIKVLGDQRHELRQENARLTAECKRLDNAVAEVWDNVHRVVQQAWVKPHDYDDSPLDLIAAVIDERDEAEQENARLTADRDEWMASSAGYGSDMLDQKVRAEQAEQQRDAAHAALREIRVEAAMGAYNSDGTIGGGLTALGCLDIVSACDAALAASAPQKEQL